MGEYAVPGACVVAVVFLNKRLESNVNRQFNTRFCSILRLTILLIDIFPAQQGHGRLGTEHELSGPYTTTCPVLPYINVTRSQLRR